MSKSTMVCADSDDAVALIACRPLISTLPNDILSNIFLVNFQMCRDDKFSAYQRKKFRDRGVFVTHVCRHWRLAALDYAPIWTFIVTTSFSPEQIKEYLVRSKNSKLTVYLSFTIKKADSIILKLFRDHVWRIKEFHLFSKNLTSRLRKSPFLLDTAHNLQLLTLHCENRQYEHFMPAPASFNSKITSCHFPSLRELVMVTAIPYSTLPWLNTITSLTLSNIRYMQSEHTLLQVLAQCSEQLESLSLIDVSFDGMAILFGEREAPPNVNFLALRDLTINREIFSIGHIYSFVKFPKRLSWKMTDDLLKFSMHGTLGLDGIPKVFPTEIYPENEELKITFNKMKYNAECVLAEKPLSFSDQSRKNSHDIVITAEADQNSIWRLTATVLFRLFSFILPPTISKLEFVFVFKADSLFGVLLEGLEDMIKKMENIESLMISLCGEGGTDEHSYVDLQHCSLLLLKSTMVFKKKTDNESGRESDSKSGNGGGESEIQSECNNADVDNKAYWPRLEVFTLDKFHFGDEGFLYDFINFLSTSIIRKRQIRLNIDDAHALSRGAIDKIRRVVAGVFYVDGVEIM